MTAKPSRSTLISRARADVESALQNGATSNPSSVETVLSTVVGTMNAGAHARIDIASRQILPDPNDPVAVDYWAQLYLNPSRILPVKAQLTLLVTGEAESVLPLGSVFTAGTTLYETDEEYEIPAASPLEVLVNVTALSTTSDPTNGTGSDGNVYGQSEVRLRSPVTGIDAVAVVQGSPAELVGGGSDIETTEAQYARLQTRIQSTPTGSSPGDLEAVVLGTGSATRAWERPKLMGPATIVVYFVQDVIDDDGVFISTTFPGTGVVESVQDALDLAADVIALPIAAVPERANLNPAIDIRPNNATNRSAVTNALERLMLQKSEPGGTLLESDLNEAVSTVPGLEDWRFTSPIDDVTSEHYELRTLGTVTFGTLA